LGTALAAYHHCLLEAAQDSAVLAAMGSALKEQLRQFLWRNPMTRFYLRGWIGVHKERLPPRP
jgi:hypothetical protein